MRLTWAVRSSGMVGIVGTAGSKGNAGCGPRSMRAPAVRPRLDDWPDWDECGVAGTKSVWFVVVGCERPGDVALAFPCEPSRLCCCCGGGGDEISTVGRRVEVERLWLWEGEVADC